MNELKPCPFCGNKEPYFGRTGTGWHSCIVECGNCGCSHESGDEGEHSGSSWNARDESELSALREKCEELQREKDGAYLERNKVVAALARLFPSGIARTNIEGWSDDWHGCVYIDLPTGQVSWHYHDSHAHLFDGLPAYQGSWDGHTTEEKYSRLSALRELFNIPALIAAAKQEERERNAMLVEAGNAAMRLDYFREHNALAKMMQSALSANQQDADDFIAEVKAKVLEETAENWIYAIALFPHEISNELRRMASELRASTTQPEGKETGK